MEIHHILAAVITSMAMHRAMEPDNLFRKLRRLDNAIKTGTIDELPMKGIDTRPKAYAVGIAFLLLPAVIAYLIVKAIDPGTDGAMRYAIAVSVVGELILLARLDKFHVDIEKITQSVASKPKSKKKKAN